MLPIKSWCCVSILLLAMCAMVTESALEQSSAKEQFPDNLEEKGEDAFGMHKRPSFFVGSRYGRSGGGAPPLFAPSKTRRLNVVPRNDRFFLGSRYGKRAGEYISPYEQDNSESSQTAPAASFAHNKSNADGNAPHMMSCVYTGLNNLYRCNSIEEINNIINQLTTAHADDDKK